jgi:SOS-response transcriptional repressor LexA
MLTLWCAVLTPYLGAMDTMWFKAAQRRAGLTSFDLGEAIGRDRSVISRIINGSQRLTLDQARILAERLAVTLPELLEKAGLADQPTAQQLAPGFAESDAAPWVPGPGMSEVREVPTVAQALGGGRPGVDVWRVKGTAMSQHGLLPGDYMLVDTHQAERVKSGDVVVAQVYNRTGATTVLRAFAPPVLLSADPADYQVHVVDGVNVVIRGKVTASWRV